MNEELKKLGFNYNDIEPQNELRIARVTAVNKNSYTLNNGRTDIFAELSGKYLFDAESSEDFPAAGDWVYVQIFDEETFAVIHQLLPRKSLLKRKTSGKKINFQLIAANIDFALITQALDSDFNLRRLERYLVMINDAHISPVVLLSKADLLASGEIEEKVNAVKKLNPNIPVIPFSNNIDSDVNKIKDILLPQKTYCLLGSSGVGKSTLLNKILHDEHFKTQPVKKKDSKGKHTTTRRELIIIENGSIIIDTPGMRELGVIGFDSGLEDTFIEITRLANECRFRDCTHTVEEGCAILQAIKDGKILPERYQNYVKMNKESAYYEMSYLEKREKDKKFGKMVRSIVKHKKDKS
jgi:ribosome biogenesis GTPase / thiamine phosphate phosphatase